MKILAQHPTEPLRLVEDDDGGHVQTALHGDPWTRSTGFGEQWAIAEAVRLLKAERARAEKAEREASELLEVAADLHRDQGWRERAEKADAPRPAPVATEGMRRALFDHVGPLSEALNAALVQGRREGVL